MRNWTIGLITALALAPVGAAAFNEIDREGYAGELGGCSFEAVLDGISESAGVAVGFQGVHYFAGGSSFSLGALSPLERPLDRFTIASCVGVGFSADDVAVVVDGADDTFADDDLIGFGFKLAKDAGDFKANEFYTYTVGSGSLVEPADFVPAPSVTGVSALTANGTYGAGKTIVIEVSFSEAVKVTGKPTLELETGGTDRTVEYTSGSGEDTLVFTYTVQEGDVASDLDYTSTTALALAGGTILSVDDDTAAVLTLASPGQTGSLGAAKALVIDTSVPTGYSVSLDQDSINSANEKKVSFTFAGAEVGTDYSYTISSSGGGTNVAGSGTIATAADEISSLDVSSLGDGTLTLSVTLTDDADNSGSAVTDTVSKDATAPSGQSVTFGQSVVNDSNKDAIDFTFAAAEVGATYSYTISSSGGGTGVTGSGTIATATDKITGIDLSGLEDGKLILSVTLTDAENNAATAVTDTISKDASTPSAPSAPLLDNSSNSGSTTDTLTNDTTPKITGTVEANATVAVFVGATSAGTTTADGSGEWSFTFTEGALASGANSITITAADAAGNVSPSSSALTITLDTGAPTVTITGPSEVVTEDFTVTFTFSEGVTGFIADDVTVTNGTKGTFAEPTRGSVYTLVITPDLGTTVSVSVAADKANDPAGNGNEASNTFEVSAGSPASEFAKYEQEVQQVLVDEASRSLRSSVSANQRMTQSARSRFISARQTQAREEDVTRALIPFDVDGNFTLSETGLSTAGNFFQQVGNAEGTYRRIFFGDFDVQHDNDTDSTTATLTGRMAWEQMTSEQTMLGYFIGGELATSTIGGNFEGDQDRIGVTAGGYVVHELSEQVYFDGFASVGAGRNNLEMANDTLALESEYTTQTATLGGALTGVYSQKGYDFKPELAFSYGKTWLGDIGFTGRAYGLVDNTLSLDAGDVSIASLTLRPEVIIPIGADFVADTNTQLSFAPRLVCEQIKSTTKTSDCGTGGELGFSSTSEDGLSSADMRVLLDRINGGTRSSFAFTVEHKF